VRARHNARTRHAGSHEVHGPHVVTAAQPVHEAITGMKTMVSTAGSGLPEAIETSDALRPGAQAGPWVVERELGRGGMGAVYAVVHEAIGKRAALKVVHQRLLVPGFNCDRMLLEAKVVNQVGHPNIVDIFETGRLGDGRPYIVMERLDGQPLSSRADDGKLLPDLVIAILLQVCDALIAAHAAGVVHRDLKLDNVFLVDNPDEPATPKVKLLDWGIAKVLSHDVKHTIEGQLVGTPQYLAPEQARGLPVSPQTDVYSLGVMAYELFLEQLPFEAETAAEVMAMHLRLPPPRPSELWPDVPPQLEELLLTMLAKQADQRPTTLEVARRLEAVRAELERRKQQASGAPLSVPSIPNRPSSSGELAPAVSGTWQAGTRPWQYAVGMAALIAAALLFWISRAGDQAANAATASADDAQPLGDEIAPAASLTPEPEPEPEPERARAAAAPRPRPIDVEDRSAGRAAPADVAAKSRAKPRAVSPVRAKPLRHAQTSASVSLQKPVVVPRRGAKVDPDGTLEPYR
jgi:eukaryotic-like serine/threonine-protein kinase